MVYSKGGGGKFWKNGNLSFAEVDADFRFLWEGGQCQVSPLTSSNVMDGNHTITIVPAQHHDRCEYTLHRETKFRKYKTWLFLFPLPPNIFYRAQRQLQWIAAATRQQATSSTGEHTQGCLVNALSGFVQPPFPRPHTRPFRSRNAPLFQCSPWLSWFTFGLVFFVFVW